MTRYSSLHQHRHQRIRHLKKILMVFAVLVLLGGGWLLLSYWQRPVDSSEPVATTFRSRTEEPNSQVFTTAYFQFQASSAWTQAPKESTDTIFVYRAFEGPLIQQDLTITVGPNAELPDITRVFPVIARDDGTLNSQAPISEHCSKAAPKGYKDPFRMIFQDVTFTCDTDGTIFTVLVGAQAGSATLEVPRPSGQAGSYTIVYRDLTAQPTGRDLNGIIKTFQTR